MKQTLLAIAVLLLCGLSACNKKGEQQSADPALLAYFKPMPVADTLLLELPGADVAEAAGDTIPNALFFTALDTAWLGEIAYLADSAQAVVFGRGRFSLSENHDGCLVDIQQNWFRHQSLLVYDRQRHTFTDRVTVAEWYGGDGGQVLTGSWLLDVDGDGKKDLVRREIEHWLVMQDDAEPLDKTEQNAALLLWKAGQFVPSPTADTAGLVQRFPIRSAW